MPQNITNITQNFTPPKHNYGCRKKNLHRKEKGDICTSFISIKGKSVQNLASNVLVIVVVVVVIVIFIAVIVVVAAVAI